MASTDLKLAVRRLRGAPIFTLTVILTLGLSIGAVSAVFAVVNAVFFVPLPYEDTETLVEIWGTTGPTQSEPGDYLSHRRVAKWLGHDFRTLHPISVRGETSLVLRREDGARRITAQVVSGRYFETLGGGAQRGRVIEPTDDRPGVEPTAVLSHEAWLNVFDGDPAVLGRTIVLSGRPHTVIGVMGEIFESGEKVWVPYSTVSDQELPIPWLGVGRLRPNVGHEAASVEIQTLGALEVAADSILFGGQGATSVPLGQMQRRSRDGALWGAMGATAAMLLIALANLTTLVLARTASEGRQSAVRVALGADWRDLARLHIAEGAVIAVASSAVALGCAYWGVRGALFWVGSEYNMPVEPVVDVRVLGFAVLVALGSTLLFALEPIRQFRGVDLQRMLARHSATLTMGSRQRRSRNILLGGQISIAVVLLGTAGVIAYRYQAYVHRDLGYADATVMTAVPDYEASGIDEYRQPELAAAVLQRLAARPEVSGTTMWRFIVQSYPPQERETALLEGGLEGRFARPMNYIEVDPSFFDVMGIALRAGRGFEPSDDLGSEPVAIVTETAAGRWWPDGSLLGRRIRFGNESPWVTVVGVVGEVGSFDYLGRLWDASRVASPQVFRPIAQSGQRPEGWSDGRGCVGRCGGVTIAARATEDPSDVAAAVRQELAQLSSDLPLREIGTLRDRQLNAYGGVQMRSSRMLFGAAAILSMGLVLVGVLGVVAEGVVRRTKEIGIRLALGAPSWRVVGLVARESLLTGLMGIGVGLLATHLLQSVLQSFIVPFGHLELGLQAGDWRTLVATGLLLVGIMGGTALLAARPATEVEPTVALRSE